MTMRIKKSQTFFIDERGSALVYTLMVLLLLSILGISVGMVTVGSYKLSDSNRDYASAYYIAEAGANQVKADFTKKVKTIYETSSTKDSFVAKINAEIDTLKNTTYTFKDQFNEKTSAKINISGNFDAGYKILSEGTVGKKNRTVETDIKVNWISKNEQITLPTLPSDAAILAENKLSITNGTLKGTAYISSKNKGSVYLSGGQGGSEGSVVYPEGVSEEDIISGSTVNKPTLKLVSRNEKIDWTFYQKMLDRIKTDFNSNKGINKNALGKLPVEYVINGTNKHQVISNDGSVSADNWMLQFPNLKKPFDINLTKDTYIPKMIIGSGTIVRLKGKGNVQVYIDQLELQGGSTTLDFEVDGNITVIVDDLKVLSSSININNDKNVTIIVNKTMKFNQTSLINSTKSPQQLLFVYRGPTPNFSEMTTINANIFSINNTNPMTINNSEINGVVVTDSKSVTYSGGNYDRPSDMLLIAPLASVALGSGYSIAGALLGKEVTLTGGGVLKGKSIDTSGFYFESNEESISGDLIISTPIIEPK